jgi:hypothetical protein
MHPRLLVLLMALGLLVPLSGCPTSSGGDDDDDAAGDDDDSAGDDDDATGDDDDSAGDDDDATGDDDDSAGDDDDSVGGSCTSVATVACGDSVTADTSTASNGISAYSCSSWDESGLELAYAFAAVASEDVTVEFNPPSFAPDHDIFILEDVGGGCDGSNCVGGGDTDATFSAVSGTTYYIVIDGYGGDAGEFTFDVVCGAVGDDDDSAGDDDDSAGDDDDSATGDDDDSAMGDDDDSATGDDDDSAGDDDDDSAGDDDDSAGDDDDSAGDDDDSAGDDDDSASTGLPCSGLTTFVAATGTFDDGSGVGIDYDHNTLCSWLIDVDSSVYASITLSFSLFDLEQGFDYIDVYDGADANAPLLGSFTGTTLPLDVTSSGPQLYVGFSTDSSISADGFEAVWTGNTFAPCSGAAELSGAVGSFDDGSGPADYFNNTTCTWLINGQGASSVELSFSAFDTESTFDTVTVYDGVDASAPVLGTFSGASLPSNVTSTGNFLFVEFDADSSNTADGFAASWTSTYTPCAGPDTLTSYTGTFSDGSGPNADYAANSSCSWLIDVPLAEAVVLSVDFFDTESGWDFLTIYDGVDANAPVLADLSGVLGPDVVVAASLGTLYVEFTSDSSVQNPGFVASYETLGIADECSGAAVLTGVAGALSDGAGDYMNDSDCTWSIEVPEAASIELDFGLLETEATFDFVNVYDGTDALAPLLGAYGGTPTLPLIAGTGQSLFVELDTDSSLTAAGFTAVYQAVFVDCSGAVTLTADDGAFGDGSGPGVDYPNGQTCSWLIDAPVGSTVQVTAVYYDLESSFDYVDVYDGADANATLLVSWSGAGTNDVQVTTGNQAFVEFTTDSSVPYPGFWVEYEFVP